MSDRAEKLLQASGIHESLIGSIERGDSLFVLTSGTLLYQDSSGTRRVTLRDLTRIHSDQDGLLRVETPAGTALTASLLGFDPVDVQTFFGQVRDTTARVKQAGIPPVVPPAASAPAAPAPTPRPAATPSPTPSRADLGRPDSDRAGATQGFQESVKVVSPAREPEVRHPTLVTTPPPRNPTLITPPSAPPARSAAPTAAPKAVPPSVTPSRNPTLITTPQAAPTPAPSVPPRNPTQITPPAAPVKSPTVISAPAAPPVVQPSAKAAQAPTSQMPTTQMPAAQMPAAQTISPETAAANKTGTDKSEKLDSAKGRVPQSAAGSLATLAAHAQGVRAWVGRLRFLAVLMLLAALGLAFLQMQQGAGLAGIWVLIAGGMSAVALLALADLTKLLVSLASAVSAEGGVMDVD